MKRPIQIEKETNGFFELPDTKQVWFLDTCVWSEIVSKNENEERFLEYIREKNFVAGLTHHTVIELSRAKSLLPRFDNLFSKMGLYLWLAIPYDHLFDSELEKYPTKPKIKWLPIIALTQDGRKVKDVMTRFSQNPLFAQSRKQYIDFGDIRFMSLEKFKKNFPPSKESKYTPEQAYTFARLTGIDYFCRHEPHFLKRVGVRNYVPEGIPSQFARSLFLFYKYYVHGQTPEKSDFLDYVHIAYLPYVNVFVAERNVANVIRHIQSAGKYFEDIEILHVSQLTEMILSA